MSFIEYLKSKTVLIFWLIVGGSIMTFFVCDSCSQSCEWIHLNPGQHFELSGEH